MYILLYVLPVLWYVVLNLVAHVGPETHGSLVVRSRPRRRPAAILPVLEYVSVIPERYSYLQVRTVLGTLVLNSSALAG